MERELPATVKSPLQAGLARVPVVPPPPRQQCGANSGAFFFLGWCTARV